MMAAWFRGPEGELGSEEEEEGLWEYDSTWEDEEEEEGREEGHLEEEEEAPEKQERKEAEATAAGTTEPRKPEKPRPPRRGRSPPAKQAFAGQGWRRPNRSPMSFGGYKSASRRNWMAARDMQRYRRHYPDLEETDTETREEEMWNLSFYKNEICFLPHGLHIEDLLESWQHDYAVMEENHSYIQWLFPLREPGMNWRAKLLTCKEIQAFRKSKEVMDRFVRAYKLMLGFYGIELINEETGELRRADNYVERFRNLNLYTHNNLRITRMLKCLGEMGLEHYQVHLVKFFLTETLVHEALPRAMRSALDYFMFTVRNKQRRRELVHFAWQHFEPKHEFVWGPRKKLQEFRPPSPELLNNQALKDDPELVKERAGVGAEENRSQSSDETCVVGTPAGGSHQNMQDSSAGAAESHLRSESKQEAPEKMEEWLAVNVKAEGKDVKERSPGGQTKPDGDAAEPQVRLESNHKVSEKTDEQLAANGKSEGEDVKERSPGGQTKPDGDAAEPQVRLESKHKVSEKTDEQLAANGKSEGEDVKERSSGGQTKPDGDAAEPQVRLENKHKVSEKTDEQLAANGKSEGEDAKEVSPSGQPKPDRKDLAGDCGGSSAGADGEFLKESKKRKFEMNKPSGENTGLSTPPSDIEKISSNLEGVVIDQEGPGSLQLTEQSTPSIQEGNGESQDLKEMELGSAIVKRRKVDERTSKERVAETAATLDAAVTSPESQGEDFETPNQEEMAKVCLGGMKISNGVPVEAQGDCWTASHVDGLVNAGINTTKPGLPSDCVPDKSDECIVTSMTGGEGSQPCSALMASTRQEEGSLGQEEAGLIGKDEDAADLDETGKVAESAAPLAKPDEERNPR